MVHLAHRVCFRLNKITAINLLFFFCSIGAAGPPGPVGDAGEGSFIFVRYVIMKSK